MPGMKQRIKDGMMLRMLRHSRFFDEKWYRKQAGPAEGEDAARHYYEGGWKKTDPSPRFRQESYLTAHEDVREAGVCPLAHYLFYNRKEECPGIREDRYYRHGFTRAIRREAAALRHSGARKRNKGIRILAAAHLEDPAAAGEIGEYIKNLKGYAADTVVTIPEGTETEELRRAAEHAMPGAEIMTVPARGGATGAWTAVTESRETDRYDLVIRLCAAPQDSRKGRINEGRYFRGRDRFLYGMEAVAGAGQIHRNIDRMARDTGIDLICAGRMLREDPAFRQRMIRQELEKHGLTMAAGYRFAEGGCFMTRREKAAELKEAGLRAEQFESTGIPFARAAERYITGRIPAERQAGVTACRRRERYARRQEQAEAAQGTGAGTGGGTAKAGGPRGAGTIAFAVSETGKDAVMGDAFTAAELAEAMEKKGWKTRLLNRENWYDIGPETDAVVAMLDDYEPGEIRGAGAGLVTIAWARNWFRKWTENPGIADYALIMATGETISREMEEKLGRPVEVFPIATNAERFTPAETAEYESDYCFTGNRFTTAREIETELAPEETGYRFRIYGDGWEKSERFAAYAQGHAAYEEMARIYRGTKIVLDDATPSTKEAGSINSRVYDALAAGCLVLTNNTRGAAETFGGKLPVFESKEELKALLKTYLEDEEKRREKVKELREYVLAKHTYAARAEELSRMIREARAEET